MTWLDSIYDLQYYNQPKGVPCYCETVAFPSDLQLQGALLPDGASYTLTIYVYSADGQTMYENATTYFDTYIGKVSATNHYFFNARLKSYAASMCTHACYILRAVVTAQFSGQTKTIFDKYTERYCQTSCCDVAKNITIAQAGFLSGGSVISLGDGNDPRMTGGNPDGKAIPGDPTSSAPSQPKAESACGEPVLRLISQFDCLDSFTGIYYGKPDVVLSGSASFSYVKVSTFKGRVKRKPRQIERTLSYNCKLQKVESTQEFILEGFEFFPPWKMMEIESQLHAPYIYLDDNTTTRGYQFAGEDAFVQVNKCFELFKLEATLQYCTQSQIFGCGEDCGATSLNYDGSNALFVIPGAYQGNGFYNESKQYIAHDYSGLLDYMRTRNGITDVLETDISSLDTQLYKVFGVKGRAYIPTAIYYDAPIAKNKVYAEQISDEELLKLKDTPFCVRPIVGSLSIEEVSCTPPVAGSWSVSELEAEELMITGYGEWVLDEAHTSARLYNGQVTLSIKVTNTVFTQYIDDEAVEILNAVIGYISYKGRPKTYAMMNNDNNTGLPAYAQLTINSNGEIRYTGETTSADWESSTIELNNLTYNI